MAQRFADEPFVQVVPGDVSPATRHVRGSNRCLIGVFAGRVKGQAILVSAIDCKGIPMIKREQAVKVVRNGRGKKPQKKKMATVATVFTQEPRVRTAEEVVQSLFEPETRKKVQFPRPENKRVWASLEKS